MNEMQINQFVDQYGKYFSESDIGIITTQILPNLAPEQVPRIMNIEGLKSPTTALIMAFFGLDRFYLKDYVMAILKALFYFIFIWAIIDLFTVKNRTYQTNSIIFASVLSGDDDKVIIGGRVYTKKEAKALGKNVFSIIASNAGQVKNAAKGFQDSLYIN